MENVPYKTKNSTTGHMPAVMNKEGDKRGLNLLATNPDKVRTEKRKIKDADHLRDASNGDNK